MKKTTTLLEDFIYQLYSRIDIYTPRQLDMEMIAARLGITLMYMPMTSFNADKIICIDSRKNNKEQFEEFAHELGHALLHAGNQHLMPLPYRVYLEWRADNFAAHACIPSFMLDKMDLHPYESFAVWQIQNEFNVTKTMAIKRYRQFYSSPSIAKIENS